MDRPMSGPRSLTLGLILAAVVGIAAILPRPDAVEYTKPSGIDGIYYGADPWLCDADDAVAYARYLQAGGLDEAETVALLKMRGYVVMDDRWVCPNT